MAKRYGFEYELVEYQWPRWLHGQTQKQRIIWGYKILFLDVLFPLGVKKIIFVDADQVYNVNPLPPTILAINIRHRSGNSIPLISDVWAVQALNLL